MTFPILDPKKKEPFESLNDAQKMRVVDLYAASEWASWMKHDKEIWTLWEGKYTPSNVCKSYVKKIGEVTSYCEQLMKWLIIITPEVSHIDEETGEKVIDSPAVYNTPSKTEAELVTQAFKYFTTCTIEAFTYTIKVMVEKMTVEWTWGAYKLYFDNLK